MWLQALNDSLARGETVDVPTTRAKIRDWELWWTRQHDRFPTEPRGDTVTVSQKLYAQYSADASKP
jgi:hypothetical protein